MGQDDTLWQTKPKLSFSGFLDVYYVYDVNKPVSPYRQPFFYNHNRHNEFNLNLGFVKLAVEHPKYRANLALQAGTYVQDNYAAEPDLLKNIFEANAGFSISKKNRLWIDAGIFGSHIGFESAITSDNWTLTRSLLAENSPYYLAGAKMTYKPNEKWELAALALNGWQRIQRITGNSLLSFGSQIKYMKSDKWTVNWSTFIGTDDPDIVRQMRYFSNLYGQFQLNKRWGIIAGFDAGVQQSAKYSSKYEVWLSPVLIAQVRLKEKWKSALRLEYYQDNKRIIIKTKHPSGFQTAGISWNIDYSPAPNFVWRFESRYLQSSNDIFPRGNAFVLNDLFFATSIAVKF